MQDRIRVAVNALIVRDDEALLVEFDDESGLHYNFPGGGVELGETLEVALHREIGEETSLQVTIERLLLVVESVGGRNTNLIDGERRPWNELRFFYLCRPLAGSVARLPERPDPNETDVRWVPLASLPAANVLPQVGRELLEALASAATATVVVPNPHA